MKIKDITISIFAIIGFVAILSSFNTQSQETHSTPESHIWEFHLNNPAQQGQNAMAFMVNKKTGEVRKYETQYANKNYSKLSETEFGTYIVVHNAIE